MTGYLTEDDVRRMLREACEEAGSQRAFARRLKGMSLRSAEVRVSATLYGDKPYKSILRALGLRREVRYVRR